MKAFIDDRAIIAASWQAFERLIARLLLSEGFDFVSVIGRSGDGGADVIASRGRRRWLFQVKHWAAPVGADIIARTVTAAHTYGADIPVVVSKSGFTPAVIQQRRRLAAEGINVQLWDRPAIIRRAKRLPMEPLSLRDPNRFRPRAYQEDAIQQIVAGWLAARAGNALVVLATGLGKTFVAAESCRRMNATLPRLRVLVVAHTNELVYQLERAFWPFLTSHQATVVVNGTERPAWGELSTFAFVFATRDTLASATAAGIDLGAFDVVIVDECHHLGAAVYEKLLDAVGIGTVDGPFLVGMTATPWRPNGDDLRHRFDGPVTNVDLVEGLKRGFLANVDYRIYTDNVDWDGLRRLRGSRFSPRAINRTLFINQWDDAVVERTRDAWNELQRTKRRGIVFCGTIRHAERVSDTINALGFARSAPIYSRSSAGQRMGPIERNRLIWGFADGQVDILCAVDVLNEGVDVPDVNLVVFQRVTHSRRIFLQQLGRGLRLAPGKQKVLVLDFVSDIRRFAAGLTLQRAIHDEPLGVATPTRLNLPSSVTFRRANEKDEGGASFLQEWLGDLQEIEAAGEDVSVLRFPPVDRLPYGRRSP